MIDIHSHMVPGVDDGAGNIDIAMAMVHKAIDEGVDEMILTPHHNVPQFVSTQIDTQYELLKRTIEVAGLSFTIHLGNEIHVNEDSIKGLYAGDARTLAGSQYVLMELPFHHYYPFHESMLFDLQIRGYKVILAHVERYRIFRHNPEKLGEVIGKGFYGQMTSRYISDLRTRKKALKWIKAGYVHIVASDGHNVDSRPPIMKEAYEVVKNKYGEACAMTLFEENPRRIINDEDLVTPEIVKKPLLLSRLFKKTQLVD